MKQKLQPTFKVHNSAIVKIEWFLYAIDFFYSSHLTKNSNSISLKIFTNPESLIFYVTSTFLIFKNTSSSNLSSTVNNNSLAAESGYSSPNSTTNIGNNLPTSTVKVKSGKLNSKIFVAHIFNSKSFDTYFWNYYLY